MPRGFGQTWDKTFKKMKKLIVPVLIILSLLACQKTAKVVPKSASIKDTVVKTNSDTIPELATIGMIMQQDSAVLTGTQFMFSKTFHLTATDSYDGGSATPGGPATGPALLYALSSDGKDLVNDAVPYTPGMATYLDVTVKNGGNYILKAGDFFNIPSYIRVWLRDTYLKDSTNLSIGNYHFNIDNSNPATYGKKRFQVVFK
jgi:hypothetical protein